MIWETVITTLSSTGEIHIVPMGIRTQDGSIVLSPFRPSITLDNLISTGYAVVNYCDDVRVIAGCLTGRVTWPTIATKAIPGVRLRDTLAHNELKVIRAEDDDVRPNIFCASVREETHRPFRGFNRAQAAVVEASILVSRLDRLPLAKIESEVQYLSIAIEKTAGPHEREAWGWLMDAVKKHQTSGSVVHDGRN